MKNEFIEAGKIVNTHGIAGAVKVEVWLDSPVFMKKFHRLFVGRSKREYKILSSSVQKSFLLVSFEGVEDINAAMTLRDEIVYISRDDAKLPSGRYFLCDIIGSKVIDDNGDQIGTLEDIWENPAQPIYVVRGEKEYLIPAVPEFILSVDPDQELIRVHLLEGM
ncbi:MAG: ribosome maturation factor RimM [Eubacteriales bacterium]|nr:ribosome maturation factor RimM [Eubacteriales bacterium]